MSDYIIVWRGGKYKWLNALITNSENEDEAMQYWRNDLPPRQMKEVVEVRIIDFENMKLRSR